MKRRRGQRARGRGRQESNSGSLLEGAHWIREAIRAGRRTIHSVQIAGGSRERLSREVADLMDLAREHSLPVDWQPGRTNPMITASAEPFPLEDANDLLRSTLEQKGVLLVCDRIQDPQNLGAILRSYYAFGGECVLLTREESAEMSDTVARVSSGASEHLRIAQTSGVADRLRRFREGGGWLLVTDVAGSQDLGSLPKGPMALVIGNEHRGVRDGLAMVADFRLRIPMRPDFDSLNAAQAATLLFYELSRQGNLGWS